MSRASSLESLFAAQLATSAATHSFGFDSEVPFAAHLGRKFRADFMVSARKHWTLSGALDRAMNQVLVEIQGTGPQGRHGSYGHHNSDCEKFSIAAALGYRVLPLSARMVRDGSGLALVEAALGLRAIPLKAPKARRKSVVPRSSRKTGKELPERVKAAMRRAQA